MIVLGSAAVVVGILLVIVSVIVNGAITASPSNGCAGSCTSVNPAPWFGWIGVLVLLAGALSLVVGIWKGLLSGRP